MTTCVVVLEVAVDLRMVSETCNRQLFCSFRRWEANEARVLRVSVNGFLDHLALVTQTIAEFGPPADNTDTQTNSCIKLKQQSTNG